MTKIVYDMALMQIMNLFEKITHAKLKDCFIENEQLFFVVQELELGKALGNHAINVKKLQETLNRKIKIVEFNSDVIQFVKNVLYPLRTANIEQQDDVLTITPADVKTRGYIIGPKAQYLRSLEEKVKRYFPIKEIKVTQ